MKQLRVSLVFALFLAGCRGGPTEPVAPAQPVDTARIRILVPEVYELSNIIISFTTYGQTNVNLIYKGSEYWQRVNRQFAGYRNDPVMQKLQLANGDPLRHYYEMRDNAFGYVYDEGIIKRNPAYSAFWSQNLFSERLGAVQQFAELTAFRAFYQENAAYYQDMIARYRALADVDTMADWLEREFARHYDHYTVVLSPLVYGSHDTHRLGNEIVMFVSGPDVGSPTSTPGVNRATVQRILFTEVDHNFVNPVTDQYRSRVESVFGTRAKWTIDASSFYSGAYEVFNEYMTWAVFLLYIEPRLNAADFAEVSRATITQMETSRRFQKFGAFAHELLRLYHEGGKTVPQLYPAMLDWASAQ